MSADTDPLEILDRLLGRARAAGADAADALLFTARSIEVAQRLGQSEKLERAEANDLGLRVLLGKRQAMVSTTDFSDAAMDETVERAVAMARAAPEDPYCGIADPAQLTRSAPDLDISTRKNPPPKDWWRWRRPPRTRRARSRA